MRKALLLCSLALLFFSGVGVRAADTWLEGAWPPCDAYIYILVPTAYGPRVMPYLLQKHSFHQANEGNYFDDHHAYWTDKEKALLKQAKARQAKKREAGL